eukprot:6182886-Pleurochrysis_carterae.AAC.2
MYGFESVRMAAFSYDYSAFTLKLTSVVVVRHREAYNDTVLSVKTIRLCMHHMHVISFSSHSVGDWLSRAWTDSGRLKIAWPVSRAVTGVNCYGDPLSMHDKFTVESTQSPSSFQVLPQAEHHRFTYLAILSDDRRKGSAVCR